MAYSTLWVLSGSHISNAETFVHFPQCPSPWASWLMYRLAGHRRIATFVPSCAAQRVMAVLAQGQHSALSGIHCGLGAAAGTGFQTKYGAQAQASPHLHAVLGPKPPVAMESGCLLSSPPQALTHKSCTWAKARQRSGGPEQQ